MIKPRKSMLKSLYETGSLLAVLNMVVLIGVVGALAMNGTLTTGKISDIVAVLKGEPGGSAAAPLPAPATSVVPETPAAAAPTPVTADDVAVMELESQRLQAELEQRVALANSIMLKVRSEREAFRQERDAAQKQAEAEKARQQDQGFQKQLDILTSLAPKMALEHLLALNDMHKAARILMSMETDQAKKIVESARRGEDLARMKVIVQLMQDVTPLAGTEWKPEGDGEER